MMAWDISNLPDNIKIELTKKDLLVFADKLLKGMPTSVPIVETNQEDILDFNGMCRFLGIAKSTGYAKTSQGILPHFKKGRKLFFRKSELIAWIEEGRIKTSDDLDSLAEKYLKKSKL